jgi:hypothetical protein
MLDLDHFFQLNEPRKCILKENFMEKQNLTFEQFDEELVKNDYDICAMNHFCLKDETRMLYCVIFSKVRGRAFVAEGKNSGAVFFKLLTDLKLSEKYDNP